MNKLLKEIISNHLLPSDGPGYSITVELEGKTVFQDYSGYANLDYDIPVGEQTVFSVASLAKQFTACCIAILACEKRINLDDSICDYIPGLKEYAEKITIRHLIFHTAGFSEKLWLKHCISNSTLSETELFNRQNQPYYEPGDFFIYSNTCYSILGNIIELVTGTTEHEFAKQKIFDPLGMVHTHFHQDANVIIKNCATAYQWLDDGTYKIFDNRQYPCMGDDGLYTTAEDLILWHNCLINKKLPGMPSEIFDLLFSSFTLSNGELIPYGFGFFYDKDNRNIIWHHGDNSGWQCVMRLYLDKKLSIIVLSNSRNAKPVNLALDIENAIIKSYFNIQKQQSNYFSDYRDIRNRMNYMANTLNIKKAEHHKFPQAKKQNVEVEKNWKKYVGRYYCYELDTYFDIFINENGINMKYTDIDDPRFTNLINFTDKNNIKVNTRGDWGSDVLPVEFFGSERKIEFFTLQNGCGHFYFDNVTNCDK